jgi:gag-polyprotein putative aspartyl protease
MGCPKFSLLPSNVKSKTVLKEVICPLVSRNYKVSATVGVNTVIMAPVRAILDTGAGPNLIREEILPEEWERSRLPGTPAYQIIGGRPLRQRGVITMHVQLGTLRVQSRFVVVSSLAAECILGSQFINRHVRMISPKEKYVVLANDNLVSIFQDAADWLDYGKVSSPEQVSSPPPPSS